MARIHETLNGHRIEYPDPSPELAEFLDRFAALAGNRSTPEADLIALLYGRENPILDRTMFADRGAVTRAVLENPVYSVLTDLLERRRLTPAQVAKASERYTLTVSEAAARLQTSESAVRQAIASKRLPSWRRDGQHYVDPGTLESLRVGQRGPTKVEPLSFHAGYAKDLFLRVKTVGGEVPSSDGDPGEEETVSRWRRVAVLTAGHGKMRMFVIEPSAEKAELKFHNFFVRGRFAIVEKVNDSKRARQEWKAFQAV